VEEEYPGLSHLRILFKDKVAEFAASNAELRLNKKHLIGEAMWVWLIDEGHVSEELQHLGNEVHHGRKTGKDGHPLWRIAFRRTVRGDEVLDRLFDGKRLGPTPLYARLQSQGLVPEEPGELIRSRSSNQASGVEDVETRVPRRAFGNAERYVAQNEFELHPSGTEWVYVYTTARELKLFEEKQIRPLLKVGSTRGHYADRIAAQAGSTAAHSTLVCLHACRVLSGVSLERKVHKALKAQDRHVKDVPGIEWFDATPEEVEKLLRALGEAEDFVEPWGGRKQ
jgi:hypothetical protein